MIETQPAIWPMSDLVIFDCDSTLSSIEGIDELASLVARQRAPDSEQQMALNVAALTKRAMEGDVPLESVYGLRLGSVNPTQAQVRHIASIYRQTTISDGRAVLDALQTLGVQVFIVSGGLIEPVRDFGNWLGIPSEHIFAVAMEYDQLAGNWWRYWEQPGGQNPRANYLSISSSPLTGTHGKNRIVAQIRALHHGRAMLVGDGRSDLEASEEVDLFVGFGGAVYRQRVAQESPVYISSPSLSPILPLALGSSGNVPRYTPLWSDGLRRIYSGEVQFRDEATRDAFLDSIRRNPKFPAG
jgi:phosphoserine phosphatase